MNVVRNDVIRSYKHAMACVSHDLQTDLFVIKANLEELRIILKDQKSLSCLNSIDMSIKNINWFLNHTYSNMITSTDDFGTEISFEKVSIVQELEKIISDYPVTALKNKIVRFNLCMDFLAELCRKNFQQVINNVIKNSVYFSSNNKDPINLTVLYDGELGYIIISNNGYKMTEEAVVNVFTTDYSSRIYGFGTGLMFCKKAMNFMGGDITYKSANEIEKLYSRFPDSESYAKLRNDIMQTNFVITINPLNKTKLGDLDSNQD